MPVNRIWTPALLPPACCEVRPGKIPTALSPKLWKMLVMAWPKPLPYAVDGLRFPGAW